MNIKRKFALSYYFLFTLLVCSGEKISLWPDGKIPNFQSQQIAATTKEVKQPGFKREAHTMPYLEWYQAPAEKNGAVCCSFQVVVTRTAVTGLEWVGGNYTSSFLYPGGKLSVEEFEKTFQADVSKSIELENRDIKDTQNYNQTNENNAG